MDYKIILASKSEIRKKMLEERKIPFEVVVSNVDETPNLKLSITEQFKDIAYRKARDVFKRTEDEGKRLIIAANQIIYFKGKSYGKPKSIEEARQWINSMQEGESIYAIVGNALIFGDIDPIVIQNVSIAKMYMEKMPEEIIEKYLKEGKPLTKCGGINIIDTPGLYLKKGLLSTAKGMTIELLDELLKKIQN